MVAYTVVALIVSGLVVATALALLVEALRRTGERHGRGV